MIYSKLSADEVTSVYHLIRFLERLRIIGYLSAHTESNQIMECNLDVDSGGHEVLYIADSPSYTLVKDGYDPVKGVHIASIEMLEKVFGRLKIVSLKETN